MTDFPYQDELWNEIPGRAYVALGRRGQDYIDLHQCFNPQCSEGTENDLHPISKTIVANSDVSEKMRVQEIHFKIHCDHCNQEFLLIIKRHFEADARMFDRISAANPETLENYGEIGIVQYKRKK